jgi:endonuclease YncB( thermonuclease family)
MAPPFRALSPRWQVISILFLCVGLSRTAQAQTLYGTQTGKVYHNNLECPSGKKILEENRIKFADSKEAEDQGRRLCKTCQRMASKKNPPPKPTEGKPLAPAEPTSRPAKKTATSRPAIDPAHLIKITSIQAGGTLTLDTQEKARLLGVCLPERGQPFCDEAIELLEAQHRIRKCVTSWDDSQKVPTRDGYGRLQYYLKPVNGGSDLGAALLNEGLAWVDWEHSFGKQTGYFDLEYQAWVANRGMWKRLNGVAGMEKVETGRHAREYHPANCPHHAHLIESVTITINEAKARRLVPCAYYHTPFEKAREGRAKGD